MRQSAFWIVLSLAAAPAFTATGAEHSPSSVSEYDAVVLEATDAFEVRSTTDSRYTVKRRIEIRNQAGKSHGQVQIYESNFIKLLDLSGAVYDRAGRELSKLSKNDVRKECGQGEALTYSNDCVSSFQLSSNSYPFVVEYEYTVRRKSLFFWPDWSPQDDVPVRQTKYTLDVPRGFSFRTRVSGNPPAPTQTQANGRDHYEWAATEVPAFSDEPFMPPRADYDMRLRFAPSDYRFDDYDIAGTDWQTLSRSYFEMARDAFKLKDDQISLIQEATKATAGERAMVAGLYQRLLDRTRYLAVAIGIGGWQPAESFRTFAYGYGDCKGLSVLHASMLRYAGIPSRLCLLATRDHETVDSTFPSLGWFNHMIFFLLLDGDTVWADPTCHECPLGRLRPDDEDVYALVIDSAGGPLIKTPASAGRENAIRRKVSLTAGADGSLDAELEICALGNPGYALQRLIKNGDADDRSRWAKSRMYGLGNDFAIVRCATSPPAQPDFSGNLRITAKADRYVHLAAGKAYLNPSVISLLSESEDTDLHDRTYPLDLGYPRFILDTIIVQIPSGNQVLQIPADTSFEDQFGALRVAWTQLGDRLVCVREKHQNRYWITPAEVDAYATRRERIRNAMKAYIVFGTE